MHRKGTDLETLAKWCAESTRAIDVATGSGHTAEVLLEIGVPNIVTSDASVSMVAMAIDSYPGLEGLSQTSSACRSPTMRLTQ